MLGGEREPIKGVLPPAPDKKGRRTEIHVWAMIDLIFFGSVCGCCSFGGIPNTSIFFSFLFQQTPKRATLTTPPHPPHVVGPGAGDPTLAPLAHLQKAKRNQRFAGLGRYTKSYLIERREVARDPKTPFFGSAPSHLGPETPQLRLEPRGAWRGVRLPLRLAECSGTRAQATARRWARARRGKGAKFGGIFG